MGRRDSALRTLGPGSYVITPAGRVGLWTSTTHGVALVMSGDDRLLVPAEELRSAFEDLDGTGRPEESSPPLCKVRR